MNMIIFACFIFNQIQLNMAQPGNGGGMGQGPSNVGRDNTGWQNLWDLIKNFGPENCPRCASPAECYVECNTEAMQEFTGVSNWANCKDQCLSLGGDFAYEFDTGKSDRGCAMYSQRDMGKCVCIPGNQFACRNIQGGSENCPNCGGFLGIFGGAPECLAECDVDKRREFTDIADWGDCKDRCKSLGGLFTYKWGTLNSNRACAIYAKYDGDGNQGKCVCVRGNEYACDNTEHADAPPAILPPDIDAPAMPMYPSPETSVISYEMIEGYGIGVITTLIILLIGLFVSCLYRRSKYNSKAYAKVNFMDSEDERIVINNQ